MYIISAAVFALYNNNIIMRRFDDDGVGGGGCGGGGGGGGDDDIAAALNACEARRIASNGRLIKYTLRARSFVPR
jgi:hypothetical protein